MTRTERVRWAHRTLAFIWGPVMITLTVLGPTRHLSSLLWWVAIVSYYANMAAHMSGAAGAGAKVAIEDQSSA